MAQKKKTATKKSTTSNKKKTNSSKSNQNKQLAKAKKEVASIKKEVKELKKAINKSNDKKKKTTKKKNTPKKKSAPKKNEKVIIHKTVIIKEPTPATNNVEPTVNNNADLPPTEVIQPEVQELSQKIDVVNPSYEGVVPLPVITPEVANIPVENIEEPIKQEQPQSNNSNQIPEDNKEKELSDKQKKRLEKMKKWKRKGNRPSRLNLLWVIPLLIIYLVGVAIPIGFYFAVVHDTSTKQNMTATGNIAFDKMATNLVAESISNIGKKSEPTLLNSPFNADATKDVYGKMVFNISPDQLDELAMFGCNQLKTAIGPAGAFFSKMYFEVNGNNYDIYLDINISDIVRSRVGILTTLSEEVDTTDPNNPAAVFEIRDIKLGRFTVPDFLIDIMKNMINNLNITSLFEGMGIHLTVELENLKIKYKRQDFINDMKNIINKSVGGNESLNILTTLIGNLIDKNLSFTFEDAISFEIDLTNYHVDKLEHRESTNIISPLLTTDQLNEHNKDIKTLFSNGTITTSQQAQDVFMFLIHGKDDGSDALKTFYNNISNIDLSSIKINKETYKGDDSIHGEDVIYNITDCISGKIPTEEDVKMADIYDSSTWGPLAQFLVDFVPVEKKERYQLTSITESNLNNFAKSTPLLGNTIFLTAETSNGLVANYITISDLNFNFYIDKNPTDAYKDRVALNLIANLNGYEIGLSIILKPEKFIANPDKIGEDGSVTEGEKKAIFSIENIYVGNEEFSEEVKKSIIDYVINSGFAGKGLDESMYINTEEMQFVFDFAEAYRRIDEKAKKFINKAVNGDLDDLLPGGFEIPNKYDIEINVQENLDLLEDNEDRVLFSITKEAKSA